MIALKLLMNVAERCCLPAQWGFRFYGLWLRIQVARKKAAGTEAFGYETVVEPEPIPWRRSAILAVIAVLPLLLAAGIVVVPSGMGGVRISQMRGTLPGTLYPGIHFIIHSLTACRLSICTITCFTVEFSKRA